MTSIAPSPGCYPTDGLKKRSRLLSSSSDAYDSFSDHLSSRNSTKRRCRGIEFDSFKDHHQQEHEQQQKEEEEKDILKYTQRHMDYFDQVKQAELARLRTEYEQFILKKEQEMNHFKQQIVFLHEKNVAQEKEMEKNLQENKILKRAVTIQNQQKEECQQENIMLKSLAQQAAEHIKRLEQTNYALRVHLQTSTTSQIDHHTNSPPDVF